LDIYEQFEIALFTSQQHLTLHTQRKKWIRGTTTLVRFNHDERAILSRWWKWRGRRGGGGYELLNRGSVDSTIHVLVFGIVLIVEFFKFCVVFNIFGGIVAVVFERVVVGRSTRGR
jgi:hypothetical protein